jgi:hypothetical protein
MKKKLLLLGAALAISAVSAQAVFAAQEPTLSITKSDACLPDISNVKIGEAKAIGKVNLSGVEFATTTAPGKATLVASGVKLDLSKVKVVKGELKAVGKVNVSGTGFTTSTAPATATLVSSGVKLDLSKVKLLKGQLKAVGKVSIPSGGQTTQASE